MLYVAEKLQDTIINFGEDLRQCDLDMGFNQGATADLMLCIGSSLRVNPAAQMVEETSERGGRVWIINLQKTPHTPIATQIYAKIDDVLGLLMNKLNMAVPAFTLKRHARFTLSTNASNGKEYLAAAGIDENGGPYTIFNGVHLNGEKMAKIPLKDSEKGDAAIYEAIFKFQGHYNETDLSIQVRRALFKNGRLEITMVYNPHAGAWELVLTKDQTEPLLFKAAKAKPID